MNAGGFMSALFDFSFTKYITKRAIAIIYILAVVIIGLLTFAMLLSVLTQGGAAAAIGFLVVPLIGLMYLIYTRLFLEFLANQFRQTELLEQIASK